MDNLGGGPGLHLFDDEEVQAVADLVRSRKLTRYSDPDAAESQTYRFEQLMAARLGVKHCLATNSCSAALLAGLWSLDLQPGDEVLVPGFAFASCYATVAYAGGVPVLTEVDDTLSIDPSDAKRRISTRTRAILAVHMLGRPARIDALVSLADQSGIELIEDVAQACGGQFQGVELGAFGRFSVFSFNPYKIMTSGDGGLLATNDSQLYERAFATHDHGAWPLRTSVGGSGPVMGLNFRMNEIAAAVAVVQIKKLSIALASARQISSDLTRCLQLPDGVSVAPRNDVAGDCGSSVVLRCDTPEQATSFAAAIGTHPLSMSGKHNYSAISQLAEWKFPQAISRPDASIVDRYQPGSLPETDHHLACSVALGVGVHDDYLGTGVGPSVLATSDEVERLSHFVNEALARTFHV